MSESTPKVYAAIAAVAGRLSKEGIAKDRKNDQQGYRFRGVDDIYNALAPFLAAEKLCVLPRVISRDVVERVNKKETVLFYVTVGVEFDFVSAEDGSRHTVKTYGEAMDSGDKATNKAMSAAYKYACMQAFCIPTEGDNDADATTHEVAGGLAEATVAELMGALDKAPDVEVLRTRTKAALAAAKAANDPTALARLREHAVKVNKMLEEAATA